MMMQDANICKYVYEMPGPTYQYARYIDWIADYVPDQKRRLQQGTDMTIHSEENIGILTVIEQDLPLIERKVAPLVEAWTKARQDATP